LSLKKYKLYSEEINKREMATATIKEVMLAGSGNFIQQEGYYDTWKADMSKYQETRTAWKEPVEPYVKRTYKDIKMRETSYDPIV